MDRKNLLSKWIVIAGVLLLFGWTAWNYGLNLGLDLRGGTSLLYEVNTAGAPDPEEVIKQVIDQLSKRVDPSGTRNLIWRVEAGSRIEIQMPQPPKEAKAAREKLEELLSKLEAGNISRAQLSLALRQSGPARQTALGALSKGDAGRMSLLTRAADAFDAMEAARAGYETVKDDTAKSAAAAEKFAAAEKAYDQAAAAVIAGNLDRAKVGQILEMSTIRPRSKDKAEEQSPRDKALALLIADHADHKAQIEALVDAYDAYQKVKGPLEDANDLIRLLKGSGVLEFRIAASPDEVGNIAQARQTLAEKGPNQRPDPRMAWFPLDDPATWAETTKQQSAMREDSAAYFTGRGLISGEYGGKIYLLLWDSPDKSLTARQADWKVAAAHPDRDQYGFPAVSFQMDPVGGNYMAALTGGNVNRQMAIVLDSRVYSAPNIHTQIGDAGIISGGRGGFGQKELDYLVRTLGAGSLKARLSEEPISIRNIGPSLGADNLDRGLRAVSYSLVAVGLFMIVYYFFGGLVATLAVLANITIVLGVMAGIRATFTLPGIAGIVLTIGMCVDANVLIFERIREELKNGADMFTALRLGYEKALSAIVDGNMTTLIICFVLGYWGTADIAGFGVTLGIGIVATLFASLFMTHVFFLSWYGVMGVKKKMKMLPIVVPAVEKALHPNIDWLGRRGLFYTISFVACVLSLVMCFTRGADMLDVEFRGGTEVGFETKDNQLLSLPQVRQRLAATPLPDVSVVAVGDVDKEFRSTAFSVITSESDARKVTAAVREAFKDVIRVDPVIHFKAEDKDSFKDAPVYAVKTANVGSVIGRPGVDIDAGDAVGGVAIVIEDMNPPVKLDELAKRIKTMRLQPDFESSNGQPVQFRSFEVKPLATDPAHPDLLTAAVVLVKPDAGASYFEDAAQWELSLATVEWKVVRSALSRETSLSKVSNFTPTVARTMTQQALIAIIISSLAIIAYVWVRFGSLRWGLGAILALVHDVIIAMGVIAFSGYLYEWAPGLSNALLIEPFKINMTLVAAILTIIGYSINDTIVVYDRIRENKGKLPMPTLAIMNTAVNQTFSRTLLTGGTTIVAVLVLYIIAGEAIRGFALAIMIGVITGTYSSWAIASPLLLIGRGKDAIYGTSPTRPPQVASR